MNAKRFFPLLLAIAILFMQAAGFMRVERIAQGQSSLVLRADALVLVNSASPGYADFEHFIQPYLDQFGVPYTILDVTTTPVTVDIGAYALVIIGHRQLDTTHAYLDSTEEGYLAAAVNDGAGLVNFDNDLSDGFAARYAFIDSVFGFGYGTPAALSDIHIVDTTHFITERHADGETTTTAAMTLAGIALPPTATALATAGDGSAPFLAVTAYGQGRGVQWGTYDWMSHAVKGPVYDLDDLVWRSLVWAARKPFVIQGMPPFVTMRMDDTSGPLDWIQIANDNGFIPWAGVFTNDIDAIEAADMAALASEGKATFGMHAFGTSSFFYFDHAQSMNFTDSQVADNFAQATQWFQSNTVPISKYAVGHYYELGSNVFEELQGWGVEYVGTMIEPGQPEANSPWVQNGPFRLYESGTDFELVRPVYYADYLPIPGHPELADQFFNCITEMRDIADYEWHPSPNIDISVERGTHWITRAINNMELATLFTHEYDLDDIDMAMWQQIMQGITQNLAAYQPVYVSLDYACQYARAMHDSSITAATYSIDTNQLITSFGGESDLPAKFYVFSDNAGQIQQQMVDVPVFTGSTQVTFSPPGQLHHIAVSPNPAVVAAGGTQQFSAAGYDIDNNPIQNLTFIWEVRSGGGSIDSGGLFTAGLSTGVYTDTVVASSGGVEGTATVEVIETTIDHFGFDPIAGPVYSGTAFPVTLRALDVNGSPVVGYDGQVTLSDTTGTLQPALISGFTNGVWTGTVTISQTATGVTITASDGIYSGASGPFDVIEAQVCPCSIWDNSAVPENLNVTDNVPIELGLKFQSLVDGYITGLRFYKGYQNTGTHTGHLWSEDGTLLSTVTFTGETDSGWQQISLDAPVSIAANTTYIASYFSPGGYFSDTPDGLFTATLNAPLKALAFGEDGPNGVYRLNSPGFPNLYWTGHAPNYWVDVVFEITVGPDTTPPTVRSVLPRSGAVGINIGTNASAVFSEPLNPATVNSSTFELRDPAGVPVSAAVTYTSTTRTAVLDPSALLANSTTYTAVLRGGPEGIQDTSGNALVEDYTWTFSTEAPPSPPPTEGPGGPILIISSANNPFSRYYTEILRAEGLNAFFAMDITQVTAVDLLAYDVILLGEMPLGADQAAMLADWVNAGGNLIAMRPDPQFNSLMGLSSPEGTLAEGYLLVDTTREPGLGIVGETIQYHGTADLRTLQGATSIATLYQDATTSTGSPAVTINNVGSSGGQAAAYNYDLARSVVYTRQGNPAWAGTERDGDTTMRSDDMFFGNASYDPQPDWVNLNKVAIPQADEQQRLLANLILYMEIDRLPLPRFWYLPRGEKAVVLMTGDDHNGGGTAGRFDYYMSQSPTGCSLDDWECVRATSYIYPNNILSDGAAATYQAQGFEIALHLNTSCINFTSESLAIYYDTQLIDWQERYTSLNPPKTERTHCIVWSDWDSQVNVKLDHSMRMDLNYYFWPPEWVQNRPGLFTGSGMPMRFADINGNIKDVYQAVTQMTDESGQTYPFTIDTLLDRALGSEGYYGIFTANMHHDSAYSTGATAIVNSAQSRGVPVISAEQALRWLDGRNNSSFENLTWADNTLSFQVAFALGSNGLQAMLPYQSLQGPLTGLTLDGIPVGYTVETIKGVEYAIFQAGVGSYQAVYNVDTTPPFISGAGAQPALDRTASIYWATNEPAVSRVDYGTNPDALDLFVTDGSPATAHNLTLTSLAYETTYYYRITATDGYNNSATWPEPGSPPASFTTPVAQFVDTSVADFQAGTPDAGIYIAQTEDGEVLLAPTVGEEFSGDALPATWSSGAWTTGGSSTVSGGQLVVDGARANTNLFYASGRAVEFSATFAASTYQHAGFGQTLALFSESWAMFSTMNTTTTLFARINRAGTTRDVAIPGSWLGAPHRYRIEWNAASIVFLIDGTVVHTEPAAITANMRPLASDAATGGQTLRVDWMRMDPHAASGAFQSRIFDAGARSDWNNITWNSSLPASTDLVLSARTGNTPTPDATWTAFTVLETSGAALPESGRYFQYQAGLSTANTGQTPVLSGVSFEFDILPEMLPIANPDAYTTTEDVPIQQPAPGLLANDTTPWGDPLSAILAGAPAHGALTLNADGGFIYTPDPNWNGTDTFTYKANDGVFESAAAAVTITVEPVSDAPACPPGLLTISEDIPASAALTCTDGDGDALTYHLLAQPTNGSAALDENTLTYIPAANYFGPDTLTYSASDGVLESEAAVITIEVLPVNDAPVCQPVSITIPEGVTGEAEVSCTDVENTLTTFTIQTAPANGTAEVVGSLLRYTPAGIYNGADSFTYTGFDGELASPPSEVSVTVTPVDYTPVAVDDSAATLEDTSVQIDVAANDSDADGDLLLASTAVVVSPVLGALVNNGDGSFTYTPALNASGADGFTYQICDSRSACATAAVTITVTAVNDAPAAVDDAISVVEDTLLTFAVLANDLDVEGDLLVVAGYSQPALGALALNGDGTFTYAPNANAYGNDSFTYQAGDGLLPSISATVAITIQPVIDPPQANADAYSALENEALTIAAPGVLANDDNIENLALTAILVQSPANGTLALNTNGSFTYTPTMWFSGSDSFTYQASIGGTVSEPATVTITVIRTTIFNDGFESGGLSAWSSSVTDGGDLRVTNGAALGGTAYGLHVQIDDLNAIYVMDTSPASETIYDAQFSFDPNSIVMAGGNAHYLLSASNSSNVRTTYIELRYYNGRYQVRTGLINDRSAAVNSSWYNITNAPHTIEFRWAASTAAGANNGSLRLWIDGTLRYTRTGVDNDQRRVDQVALGPSNGLDYGTSGTYYLDEFRSHR